VSWTCLVYISQSLISERATRLHRARLLTAPFFFLRRSLTHPPPSGSAPVPFLPLFFPNSSGLRRDRARGETGRPGSGNGERAALGFLWRRKQLGQAGEGATMAMVGAACGRGEGNKEAAASVVGSCRSSATADIRKYQAFAQMLQQSRGFNSEFHFPKRP